MTGLLVLAELTVHSNTFLRKVNVVHVTLVTSVTVSTLLPRQERVMMASFVEMDRIQEPPWVDIEVMQAYVRTVIIAQVVIHYLL